MSQLIPPVSDRDHLQGPDGAPAVLVEYGDYECPYCGRAFYIVKTVQERMGPQLRYAYRHFPLTNVHPNAEMAAEAAEAAGAQGSFWEMHDALFGRQAQLSGELIVALAGELGLDMPHFLQELEQRTHRRRVKELFMSGVRSGVNGTPTFFINGERFDQPWDVDTLTSALRLAARLAAPKEGYL